jgi:hypothetical protein
VELFGAGLPVLRGPGKLRLTDHRYATFPKMKTLLIVRKETFGRDASVYGPYGGAGGWAAYNPRTGTYSRGHRLWAIRIPWVCACMEPGGEPMCKPAGSNVFINRMRLQRSAATRLVRIIESMLGPVAEEREGRAVYLR